MSEFIWHLPELICPLCNKKALHMTSERHSTTPGDVSTWVEIYCANYDCTLDHEDWESGCGFRAVLEPIKEMPCRCGGAHHEF